MEIISLLVVLSILVTFVFLGMATVRLIQAEDQTDHRQKVTPRIGSPSNDLTFSEASRPKLSAIRSTNRKS